MKLKRATTLLFLLMATAYAKAQTKTNTISKVTIGNLDCRYLQFIDLDKNDSTKYVYVGYQNEEYKTITDIKSIMFNAVDSKDQINEFAKTIKSAIDELPNKTDINWKREKYTINIYDFSKSIYLREVKGDGHTHISKSEALKLLDWISSLNL